MRKCCVGDLGTFCLCNLPVIIVKVYGGSCKAQLVQPDRDSNDGWAAEIWNREFWRKSESIAVLLHAASRYGILIVNRTLIEFRKGACPANASCHNGIFR